jgi:recombinational DNA repair ATPase RecF
MIFEELTLTDFRQFAGTQTIKFATDPQKNVTVVHGFNGSGKTTLLNAFNWLLYGECSPDFEGADRLESESSFKQHVRVVALLPPEPRDLAQSVCGDVTKQERGMRQAEVRGV